MNNFTYALLWLVMRELVIRPDPQRHIAYNKLYKIYRQLYDYFGEDVPSMMAELKQIRRDILER